ncbi:hypothetical protein JD844_012746, partial [Phrynosoma platyrhinos]
SVQNPYNRDAERGILGGGSTSHGTFFPWRLAKACGPFGSIVRAHQLVLPPCDVVIKAVADYVRNIQDTSDLDAIAKDVFQYSQSRTDDKVKRFKRAVAYYSATNKPIPFHPPHYLEFLLKPDPINLECRVWCHRMSLLRCLTFHSPICKESMWQAQHMPNQGNSQGQGPYPYSLSEPAITLDTGGKSLSEQNNYSNIPHEGKHTPLYERSSPINPAQSGSPNHVDSTYFPASSTSSSSDNDEGSGGAVNHVGGNKLSWEKTGTQSENQARGDPGDQTKAEGSSTVSSGNQAAEVKGNQTSSAHIPCLLSMPTRNHMDITTPPLPPVAPEVLRVAEHRHKKGLMYPYIFHVLTKGEIKIAVSIEDEANKDLPPAALLYRPVRQYVYGVLRLLLQALHLRRPPKPPKRRIPRGAVHRGPRRVKPAKRHHSLDRDDEPAKEMPAKKSKVRPEKSKERHGPELPPLAGSKLPSPVAVPLVRSPLVLEAIRQSPLRRLPHFVLSGSESEGEIRDDVPAPIPGPSTLHRDHASLGIEAESSPLDPETEKILQDNPNLVYDSFSNQFLMRVDLKTLLSRPAPPQVQVQVLRAVSPSPPRHRSRSRHDYSRSHSHTLPRAREHHAQSHRSCQDRSLSPVIIKEWAAYKGKSPQTPELVEALAFREWTCPNLKKLWLGKAVEDKNRRMRAFLACMRSDTPAMLNPSNVPTHLMVLCCVLRYLVQWPGVRILRRQELDAFLAQALSPKLYEPDQLQELKPTIQHTEFALQEITSMMRKKPTLSAQSIQSTYSHCFVFSDRATSCISGTPAFTLTTLSSDSQSDFGSIIISVWKTPQTLLGVVDPSSPVDDVRALVELRMQNLLDLDGMQLQAETDDPGFHHVQTWATVLTALPMLLYLLQVIYKS